MIATEPAEQRAEVSTSTTTPGILYQEVETSDSGESEAGLVLSSYPAGSI